MTSSERPFRARDRLRYRFDLLLSRGTGAVLLFLGLVTLAVVLIGALLLTISGQTFAGSEQSSLTEDMWQTMLRTIDAGTMASDVGWGRRVLALLVTMFGILIAGTLIGLIASGVEQRVDEMQRGRSIVVENDHIVVLGSSPRLPVIVDQLTLANQRRGGRTIVVLADEEPRELADNVRAVVTDSRGSRLVFRRGDPTRRSDLVLVGVARAREVIVLAADDEGSDARAVTATLALGAELGGFDRIPIVVELRDVGGAAGLARACAGQVHPLVPSQAIARLTAFALGQPGLNRVVEELIDFHGCDIYVRPLGDMAGATFGDTVGRFAKARPIGLMDPSGGVELNPDPNTVLDEPDRLVIVADDDGEALEPTVPNASRAPVTPHRVTLEKSSRSRTLIVGWNDLGTLLVEQLCEDATPGSIVDVVYDARLFDADEVRVTGTTDLALGLTPSRVDVWQPDDDRQLGRYTTIVLLGYRRGHGTNEADSRTLLNLMTLTQAIERHPGQRPRIIVELLNADNVDLAETSGADDCIISDAMASRLLAQLAELPVRRNVYLELYTSDGPTIRIVQASAFELAGDLEWADVLDRAYAAGFIAIGWRQAPNRGGALVMNPDVSDVIVIDPDDHLVVIG